MLIMHRQTQIVPGTLYNGLRLEGIRPTFPYNRRSKAMKKIVSMLVILALSCGFALAEGIDWASMTEEQISAALEAGQAELEARSAAAEAAQIEEDAQSEEDAVATFTPMEKGSKGDEVKTLQQRLVDLYWLNGGVDGDFGNKTKDAVERFQEEADLPVTGVVDEATYDRLFAEDAPEAQMSVSCSSIVMGSYGQTSWYVNGQSFTLTGSQTKTLKTPWGTFKFDARGEYKQID